MLERHLTTVLAVVVVGGLACESSPSRPAPAALPDAGAASVPPPASDAGAIECTPGESRGCQLDALCSGQQTCSAQGAFGACDCGSAARAGSGVVGARCTVDADCEGGATCLAATSDEYFGVGGPAGGYCTRACDSDDECAALDSESLCAQLGALGGEYCIRRCLSLSADPGEAKCLNRTDLVCVSAAADGDELFDGQRQRGYCAARCGSDEECPTGRVCDAELGICTAEQAPGLGIGARCTLDQSCSSNRCEERDAEGVGVCSALCVLGALSGCGYGRAPSAREAACLSPLVNAAGFSEGPGDLGLCRELCDTASDCERAAEGWLCTPINAGAAAYFGRSGACVPP